MIKYLFQFLKFLLRLLETIRWIKWLKQSFSEKYAMLLLNLELFNFMNALTVYISANIMGWFSFLASLMHCWMVASLFLFYKNQFPADSLSPPFSLCLKTSKSLSLEIWWTISFLSSAAHKSNEKTKSTLNNGLFWSLDWVFFPKALFSAEFTKSYHVESGLNSATTFPI